MFLVARVHYILTTKFGRNLSFPSKLVCVFINLLSSEKHATKFFPEHAKDISGAYVINQIFETVSDLSCIGGFRCTAGNILNILGAKI